MYTQVLAYFCEIRSEPAPDLSAQSLANSLFERKVLTEPQQALRSLPRIARSHNYHHTAFRDINQGVMSRKFANYIYSVMEATTGAGVKPPARRVELVRRSRSHLLRQPQKRSPISLFCFSLRRVSGAVRSHSCSPKLGTPVSRQRSVTERCLSGSGTQVIQQTSGNGILNQTLIIDVQ